MSEFDQDQMQRLEPNYLQRYGLNEAPFASTLDDRFFYATPELTQHRNMLVHMTEYSDMLLLVTGAEGSGKTSLLHSYIRAAQDNWHICRITANSMLDDEQLLFKIAEDFRLETLPETTVELQELLYDKLTRLHQNDILPVVIIDDAHTLPQVALEQLFYMTEIKADDTPMMHFVLFAEAEIEDALQAPEVSKLYEQNCHSIELSPFSEDETAEYIKYRLAVAGMEGETPFTPKIIKRLYKQSGGMPARINELAHVILDDGFDLDIDIDIDELPEDEFELEEHEAKRPMRLVAGFAAASLIAIVLWQQDRINQFFAPAETKTIEVAQTTALPRPAMAPQTDSPFIKEEQLPQGTLAETSENIAATAVAEMESTPAAAGTPALITPTIDRIVPASLDTGTSQQTLTVFGSHFTPQTKVTVSRPGHEKQLEDYQVNIESDTQLKFLITPGTKAEQWQVSLKDPGHGQSNTIALQVSEPFSVASKANDAPDWVAAQPKHNLTLQLLGNRKRKAVSDYIKRHQLDAAANIYKTEYQGKDWYVLLYGSYTNREDAKAMMAKLPNTTKTYRPWIRSFASLKPSTVVAKKIKAKPAVVVKTTTPKSENIAAHEAWLWSQDPSHYTVQLLGTQNEKNIEKFINNYKLRGKVVYFRTRRNDQDWFAVLYGAYPDNKAARSAVKQLPKQLQVLTPWVRDFSQIHAEIDTTNKP